MLNTFTPLDATTLTYDQRRTALASLIFLTEKRNGDIKARACANGKPQREHIARDKLRRPQLLPKPTLPLPPLLPMNVATLLQWTSLVPSSMLTMTPLSS